jgi:DNA-binding XRE family transcriptional regulator
MAKSREFSDQADENLLCLSTAETNRAPRWHGEETRRYSRRGVETPPTATTRSEMMKKKEPFMDWFAGQLSATPSFQQQVEETLSAMRLEQDLIALRESQGVSQVQLAKALGVSQPAIAKLESGRAKNIELRTLVRAVSALGGTVKIQITPGAKGKPRGVKKRSVRNAT